MTAVTAIAIYLLAIAALILLAAVALWPILEDVFLEGHRRRKWRKEVRRR